MRAEFDAVSCKSPNEWSGHRADRLTSAARPPGHRPARDYRGRLCLGCRAGCSRSKSKTTAALCETTDHSQLAMLHLGESSDEVWVSAAEEKTKLRNIQGRT